MSERPVPRSYWVPPGSLLAGEYPRLGVWMGTRFERYRAVGVTEFFDLTEEGEEPPYADLVDGWATWQRFPIRDFSCPSADEMTAILDALESQYPMLRGTIRDHVTGERRPFLRFFACSEDVTHAPDAPLPQTVASGAEPFYVIGAIAGG